MAQDTDPDRDAETRGMAHLGQSLSFGILSRLMAKGLLTKQEVQDILEEILISFEQLQTKDPSDESVQAARLILDAMIHAVRAPPGSRPK